MTNEPLIQVVHNTEQKRFEVRLEGQLAFAEYMHSGNNIIFHHTEVPVEFEGRGIASKIAQEALNWARDGEHRVQALCPFIAGYVEKHPEYQSITWGY